VAARVLVTGRFLRKGWLLAVVAVSLTGCGVIERSPLRAENQMPPPPPITYSQYHLDGWDWDRVARVVVLPIRNESKYTRADEEFRDAISSELQRLGRFEVVTAPPDELARLATAVHQGGRFDEALLLDFSRRTAADVIVHATLTQYSPYPRPRLGTVIQAIAPSEGKVVASIDGLWDTTDGGIAEELRTYYRQRPKPLPIYVRNHSIVADDNFASDLALDSPALFQRYVASIAAHVLTNTPRTNPGAILSRKSDSANCGPCESPRTGLLHRLFR
jgi:hypothetical protein